MRSFCSALLLVAACGAEPKQPMLANAPHPDNAVMAGAAAGVAAAAVLADPNASTRGKPEKAADQGEKQPINVKENVPASVLDRADHKADPQHDPKPAAQPAAAPKQKGPPPKIPTPEEAARKQE